MAFVSSGSEFVTLPVPVDAHTDARTACPHLRANLLDWHAASTWPSGRVPSAGGNAAVPPNVRVLLTRNAVVGHLQIPASAELIIAERAGGIALHANGTDEDQLAFVSAIVILPFAVVFFGFIIGMVVFHTYLQATNQTTYEQVNDKWRNGNPSGYGWDIFWQLMTMRDPSKWAAEEKVADLGRPFAQAGHK